MSKAKYSKAPKASNNLLVNMLPAWMELERHAKNMHDFQLHAAFTQDKHRFDHFSYQCGPLFADLSKNLWDNSTLSRLIDLANTRSLSQAIQDLFRGHEVNQSEKRPALHMALRGSCPALDNDNQAILHDIKQTKDKLFKFVEDVQQQRTVGFSGKPFTDVVTIGVGGSQLGPYLGIDALRDFHVSSFNFHFISTMDGLDAKTTLKKLNADTTLFIIISKTFTTVDTLLNAKICRDWFLQQTNNKTAFQSHFIGVSANTEKMNDWNLAPEYQFKMWDWLGGRYSIWSSVGLPIMLAIGTKQFETFLMGAHEVDVHFKSKPFNQNLPVLMGLLQVWYSSFMKLNTHAIAPYDTRLRALPNYLMQLSMESCGKSITQSGAPIDYATGPIIWGSLGHNGQHAFFQHLHQSTQITPLDIIATINQETHLEQNNTTLANVLAQSDALMLGTQSNHIYSHCPGNRPSTTILISTLTPHTLGALIALYEHQVFTQSVIWDINPFDQYGVQLGKKIAKTFLSDLNQTKENNSLNSITNCLTNYINKARQ